MLNGLILSSLFSFPDSVSDRNACGAGGGDPVTCGQSGQGPDHVRQAAGRIAGHSQGLRGHRGGAVALSPTGLLEPPRIAAGHRRVQL